MNFVAAILDLTLMMTLKFCFDGRNGLVTPKNLFNEVLHKSVVYSCIIVEFYEYCGGHIGFDLEDDLYILF